MSKISQQKALEEYPEKWYRDCDGDSWDANEKLRKGYTKGYDQAMQDFLEKAEKYLRKEFVDMWLRYMRGGSFDDEIKMFKNYIENE